jgi:hypothetical protein
MTKAFQKEFDSATRERDETRAEIDRQRAIAAETLKTTEIKAEKKFSKRVKQADAKAMNRDPITNSPGSHPIGTAVGTTGGVVAGALIGSIGGPGGSAIGGVVGAIVGAAAGHVMGEAVYPTSEETHWRDTYSKEPYFNTNLEFTDYAPAFRAGYMYRSAYPERTWDVAEAELKTIWEHNRGTSRLTWNEARDAVLAAWRHAEPCSV